jgi:non-specific serine/threonine protein kinase
MQPKASALSSPRILPITTRERRHNLPFELNSFIGREQQISELCASLGTRRLVTLIGAGGVGKSRLAARVVSNLLDASIDEAWMIELSSVADPTLVPAAVGSVLGVLDRRDRAIIDGLTEVLRDRRLLLLLDNCEHVVDACAELVRPLLSACPHVQILATSREPLSVYGELVRRVPSLVIPADSMPVDLKTVRNCEAAQLFVDRVLSIAPDFALTEANAQAVIGICRRLGGIPLAIELAAARANVLSVEQIIEHLDQSLHFLVGHARGAPHRHQTLRATIDWSYATLSPREQLLFSRLSVFVRGWTLEAAEVVGAAGDIGAGDVLDLLSGLVDKSMIVGTPTKSCGTRYSMLETIREYGRERLKERGDVEPQLLKTADYFIALAEQAEPHLRGGQQFGLWLERLTPELDDVRAALRWCADRSEIERGLRLGGALARFLYIHGASHGNRTEHGGSGLTPEAREWLELLSRLLASGGTRVARAKALNGAGILAKEGGDDLLAQSLYEESLEIWREVGDPLPISTCLANLGMLAEMRGDFATALRSLEESLTLRRGLRDEIAQAAVLRPLARAHARAGNNAAARDALAMAIELYRANGDNLGATWCSIDLAFVVLEDGDLRTAHLLFSSAILFFGAGARSHCVPECIEGLAGVAARQNDPERAFRLTGAAARLREVFGHPPYRREIERLSDWLSQLQATLEAGRVGTYSAEGRAMSVEQVLAYAVEQSTPGPAARTQSGKLAAQPQLTARESEVVSLLVAGKTNREIAEALVIARPTAERHIANILNKLGLRSRSEVAIWALTTRHEARAPTVTH